MFSVPFLEDRQDKYSSVRFMTTSRDTDRNRVGCCKPYTSVINPKGCILPSAGQGQLPFTSMAFLHVYLGTDLVIRLCLWKLAMYLPVTNLLAAHSLLEQKHLSRKKKKKKSCMCCTQPQSTSTQSTSLCRSVWLRFTIWNHIFTPHLRF